MLHDKRLYKFETRCKLALCLLFGCYAVLFQSYWILMLSDPPFRVSMVTKPNAVKGKHFDLLILGGSNALNGLFANEFNKVDKHTYNLAIPTYEGASKIDYNYENWLAELNTTADIAIYSSMNIWFLNKNSPFNEATAGDFERSANQKFNFQPLARVMKMHLFTTPALSSFGDLPHTQCESSIKPFPLHLVAHSDYVNLIAFIEKLKTIKKNLNLRTLYVRFPPVFITQSSAPYFKSYIRNVEKSLTQHNIKIIGLNDAITLDSKRMCSGPNHPTPLAGEEYTRALIAEIFPSIIVAPKI